MFGTRTFCQISRYPVYSQVTIEDKEEVFKRRVKSLRVDEDLEPAEKSSRKNLVMIVLRIELRLR